MDFDEYFMSMAYLIATRSKDESTNIGSVIVDYNNIVISTGYNSFPAGINDNVPERQVRPEKYFWMSHSELNAIILAASKGHATENCKMYTLGVPCATCGRSIINAGIDKVIVDRSWMDHCPERWLDEATRTETMFYEAGVKLSYYTGDINTDIRIKLDGRKYSSKYGMIYDC